MVMDVLVLSVVLPFMWDEDIPAWHRVVAVCIGLLAAVLGLRSALLLYRQR